MIVVSVRLGLLGSLFGRPVHKATARGTASLGALPLEIPGPAPGAHDGGGLERNLGRVLRVDHEQTIPFSLERRTKSVHMAQVRRIHALC